MLKRTLAIGLSGMFLSLALGFPPARAQNARDSQTAERMRSQVLRLGVGRSARAEVRLRDNTKVRGYVSAADQNSFTIVDWKAGASQTLAYTDVTKFKKAGSGLSTKAWMIIGGVAAGAVITLIAVKPALCDGGAQSRFPC